MKEQQNINPENQDNPLIPVQTTDWNKERLEQLKKLMPDVFTNDGKLNINELKKVIDPNSINETERYEFRWFGKSNAKREAFTPTEATLIYDEARSLNPTESENLIIEGENLAVLKLLSQSYREQIKCIYIDPPYNTGKDFVYSDNFNQDKKEYWEDAGMTENGVKIDSNVETDGRFHSNWLNMMYSRLLIARQLLREDGIIAIHIDEHEEHHLRILCEDVFGDYNFLGNIIWDKQNPKGDAKAIGYQHESVLLFAKNSEYLFTVSDLKREKPNAKTILSKAENLFKKGNKIGLDAVNEEFKDWIKCQDFSGGEKAYNKIDEKGKVYRGVSMAWPNKQKAPDQYFIPLIHPVTGKECPIPERGWRNPPETMAELLKNDLILFGEDENKQPERKYLLEENLFENIPSVIEYAGSDDALFKKLDLEFDNPKPYKFSKDFLKPFISKEDIILDFFAGSGTTGQAITELNYEDGGNRKYILVQLPEATDEKSEAYKAGFKKISDITIERNKRVIEKIKSEQRLQGLKEEQDLFKNQANQENPKNQGSDNYREKETLLCLDGTLADETVEYFKTHIDQKLIVLERALDTTKKWNLKHYMGDKFKAF